MIRPAGFWAGGPPACDELSRIEAEYLKPRAAYLPIKENPVIPWQEVDRAIMPGHEGDIGLWRRGTEFSIRIPGAGLMNSRAHGSEEALAELTCSRLRRKSCRRILVGGLGMGFTLAAALEQSDPDARVTVSELIPAVVRWNRQHLGDLAGRPLEDPRVAVVEEDVGQIIGKSNSTWDAILLDVDNGPAGLTRKANDRLYGRPGLDAAYCALRPGGILSVWSAEVDTTFTRRLKQSGFKTETVAVRARKSGKGSRYTIWLAAIP